MDGNYYSSNTAPGTPAPEQPQNPYVAESPKKQKKKPGFKTGLFVGIAATLVACLIIVFAVGSWATGGLLNAKTIGKLNLLNSVIHEYYYKDVDESDLQTGLYKGIMEGLNDPYTAYYTPTEAKALEESLTGNYAGIGAGLTQDKTTMVVTVSFVYDGSPAKEAGLQKGDVIVSADGIDATSMELSDFVQKIRGEEGTDVTLTVSRDGKEQDYTLTRRTIQVPSVSHRMLSDNVGYIRITEFSSGTADEFDSALKDLQGQGMTSVIFDLRDNPGGLVDAVTKILDELLPEGTVVYTVDHDGKREDYTSDAATYLDMPMAVLINGNSASASEIFSGAIRDFKAGTLIGTTSYGKGVVQSTMPLGDGSLVKLTTMEYFTPSGENIQGKGITPDIEVEYEFTGDADAVAKKTEEELTTEDYLNDSQVKAAFDKLTGK